MLFINNDKKIIFATIIAIILILLIILLTAKLIKVNKNNENKDLNNETINNITKENTVENDVVENNRENNILENTNKNNDSKPNISSTPVADAEQEIGQEGIQKQESNEEKAISIAKKDWGEDNAVYFSFEGINNGKYAVSVRSKENTRALRYYYINIDNDSFDIE